MPFVMATCSECLNFRKLEIKLSMMKRYFYYKLTTSLFTENSRALFSIEFFGSEWNRPSISKITRVLVPKNFHEEW